MIGIRQEALPRNFEGFPVVSPHAFQRLKRLELLAVPGIDSRVPRIRRLDMIEGQPLRQGQEGSLTRAKEMRLLCSEGCKGLHRRPRAAAPPVEYLIDVVPIGPMTGTNSRRHEIGFVVEIEEFCILAAAQRQHCVFDEAIILPTINKSAGVAIPAI